jgi:hypothetical protein
VQRRVGARAARVALGLGVGVHPMVALETLRLDVIGDLV